MFHLIRFESLIYYTIGLVSPWNIAVPGNKKTVRFHFIKKGRCYIFDEDSDELVLGEPGDIVFVTKGNHGIRDSLEPQNKYDAVFCSQHYLSIKNRKGKADAFLLCGQISLYGEIVKEIFSQLPPIICLKKKNMNNAQKHLRSSLIEVSKEEPMNEILSARIAESLFISALGTILDRRKVSRSKKKYLQVIKDIEENYDSAIDWNRYIENFDTSKPTFYKIFKELTGTTPNNYVTSIRMKKAMVLLEITDLPTKVICKKVGFQTISSFSKKFKSFFGILPSDVRKR
ncbi:helix-turn-helix domain-containing protein [Candidatus Uabimicrobium sp. HlEnr_7]|uniref:helix-turn-helix domain-containing protein n=1 Tax=Candidatus Uabimicrobium helgolandensis TaxID=3095367 RepID=UPI00355738CB